MHYARVGQDTQAHTHKHTHAHCQHALAASKHSTHTRCTAVKHSPHTKGSLCKRKGGGESDGITQISDRDAAMCLQCCTGQRCTAQIHKDHSLQLGAGVCLLGCCEGGQRWSFWSFCNGSGYMDCMHCTDDWRLQGCCSKDSNTENLLIRLPTPSVRKKKKAFIDWNSLSS